MKSQKMKPVIFVAGEHNAYRQNTHMQNLLLKALYDGVTDVKELKKLTGAKTAAEVYRTLDKLAIRKEYHKALGAAGLDLEYIAKGLKDLTSEDQKPVVRLHAFESLLKSLGLDKYEEGNEQRNTWEDIVMEIEDKPKNKKLTEAIPKDYKVTAPTKNNKKQNFIDEEKKMAKELYE